MMRSSPSRGCLPSAETARSPNSGPFVETRSRSNEGVCKFEKKQAKGRQEQLHSDTTQFPRPLLKFRFAAFDFGKLSRTRESEKMCRARRLWYWTGFRRPRSY